MLVNVIILLLLLLGVYGYMCVILVIVLLECAFDPEPGVLWKLLIIFQFYEALSELHSKYTDIHTYLRFRVFCSWSVKSVWEPNK